MLMINDTLQIADAELQFTFTRSSGPGGQNVNKVNSRAVLHWNVLASTALPESVRQRFLASWHKRLTRDGELVLASQRYRDQGRNVADCLARLREMILAAVPEPVPRKATKPSRGARQRRLSEKKATSERKQTRRRPPLQD